MRLLTAAAAFVSITSAAIASPIYRVTDLHTTGAFDLTADGTVFVNNGDYTPTHMETYSTIRNGSWAKLSLATGSRISDISDHGVILATSKATGDYVQSTKGVRRLLKPAAGAAATQARFINDSGTAAGLARYGSTLSLVLWPGSAATLSHTAAAGLGAFGNNGTAVIGVAHGTHQAPALSKGGVTTPLPGPTNYSAFGFDTNASNTVVGLFANATAGTSAAAVWTSKSFHQVAPLPGDKAANFSALNDAGLAVGSSSGTVLRATAWDGTALHDLNTQINAAGVKLIYAYDINNAGQILVQGTLNGRGDFFLLTPQGAHAATTLRAATAFEPAAVPEPATLLPLAGLAALLRRRVRSR